MKKIIAFAVFAVVGLMALQLYVNSRNANPDNYKLSIAQYRQQKDEHFRTDENSPFGSTGRFKSLRYYDAAPKYKIETTLKVLKDTATFLMRMSDKQQERFRKYGFALISIDHVKDTLYFYQKQGNTEENMLFVPFTDATTGQSTYGAGRYLDVPVQPQGRITLDFNFAYNPYCAYNYNYSCPIPPRENSLRMAIEAGEMKFKK
ncbi:hypothetical protein SAMN05421780_10222 [Flexibacter flexilis DSM 6793]|uniref:DUF1684 domain-containing protein n=1 Tax=Flexibacter flexilis DSM 6793 TaxID=927664 RepID=A0A1I1F8Z8_9BACT|nr:DUF1684 domain-containing protein [Flexibacter flexilis]SFB93560.1 hypothetical protein SAMN05421780_10222 [Flexibacter flexilis DSM 6793]